MPDRRMKRMNQMWRTFLLCAAVAVALAAGSSVSAQSGRKSKKAEAQPPIQGVNQPETRVIPEPTGPVDSKPKEKPIPILVASDTVDVFGSGGYYMDYVRQGCVAELRDNRALDIQEARDTNRAQAAKRAKEDDIFVVHLELRNNGMSSSSSSGSLDLMFTVYQPKTGKVAGSGSGYPAQGGARMPIPGGGGGYGYDQRQLELMGRDAANKALKIIREKGTSPLVATR